MEYIHTSIGTSLELQGRLYCTSIVGAEYSSVLKMLTVVWGEGAVQQRALVPCAAQVVQQNVSRPHPKVSSSQGNSRTCTHTHTHTHTQSS